MTPGTILAGGIIWLGMLLADGEFELTPSNSPGGLLDEAELSFEPSPDLSSVNKQTIKYRKLN